MRFFIQKLDLHNENVSFISFVTYKKAKWIDIKLTIKISFEVKSQKRVNL